MKGFRKQSKIGFNLFTITSPIILCISRFQLSDEKRLMKKSLASCSPGPDWEHFQKIRLKQKAME